MSEVYRIVLTTIDAIAALLVIMSVYNKKDKEYKAEVGVLAFILLNVMGLWV